MKIIEQIGEWLDRLTPLFSLILALVTWLTGFFQQKIITLMTERKLDRLMGLKKGVGCEVILPIRYGKLQQKFTGQPEFTLTDSFNYITYEETLSLIELSHLLPKVKIHLVENTRPLRTENNKVCFGSFLANDYTISFFKGMTGLKLKNRLTRGSSQATLNQKELQFLSDFLVLRKNNHAIYVGRDDEVKELIYDKEGDYLIWVKAEAEDYKQKNHGTVHIIFGDKPETVTAFIIFMRSNYCSIYDLLKKNHHLNHHFIFLRCTSTREFDMNSFTDLTDDMF